MGIKAMYESSWANTVHTMLLNKPSDVSYKDIAARSGLGIGFIETFAAGKTPNPTITRVEKLYNTLKDIKAERIEQAKVWGADLNVTE
ncbi:TPA: hypothetical protein NNP44_004560 [Salmonella enterica]|uniref:Uncharacterized protein n=3 Tax=Lokivirus IMEAB3 TaxID=2560266 RepID=A0A873WF44_9CAUD|nr:hypothetical protein vBAbaSD0_30 [Acinetobacter phage vB_AbaS_D0]QPB10411.1 hypothetical protein AbSZ3_46 [Acinetobacter phage Ab_SZ3]HCH8285005.1 hypothetical protein [Salmonella enterica]HCH8410342.1 hypothetical protein [Salmonella enterica]HCH8772100.1 hypothetical protein [Salmonella enterica]